MSRLKFVGPNSVNPAKRAGQDGRPADGAKVPASVLHDVDQMNQQACAAIMALAGAASRRLAMNADALADVRELLSLIEQQAIDHEGTINALAEENGCNWIDHKGEAFRRSLKAAGGAA